MPATIDLIERPVRRHPGGPLVVETQPTQPREVLPNWVKVRRLTRDNAREQAGVWERAQRMFLPTGPDDTDRGYFYTPYIEKLWLIGKRDEELCYVIDVHPDRQTCTCKYRAENPSCKHVQALVLQFLRQGVIDLATPVTTVPALVQRHHQSVSAYLAQLAALNI